MARRSERSSIGPMADDPTFSAIEMVRGYVDDATRELADALACRAAKIATRSQPEARRAGHRLPRVIGEVTFGVIGLLFLFADLRTFSSTFQLTFFGAPNTNLGVAAAAVFATSFLAILVAGASARGARWVSAR